jgi:tRNA(fMet)-specific endonuclease VapC
MIRLMLDTSAYSMLRRGHAPIQAAARLADKLYVSPIVLGELEAGFRRGSRRQENELLLRRFLASPRVEVAPVAEETAHCYAHIFDYLRRAGTPIPVNDLWIAASAMEHGLAVLTTDAHYRAVPQIRLDYFDPIG